jgi:hypothetical protein
VLHRSSASLVIAGLLEESASSINLQGSDHATLVQEWNAPGLPALRGPHPVADLQSVEGTLHDGPESREIPDIPFPRGGLILGQESPGRRIHPEMGHDPAVVQKLGLNPRVSKPLVADPQTSQAPVRPAFAHRMQSFGGGCSQEALRRLGNTAPTEEDCSQDRKDSCAHDPDKVRKGT